jgi:asparagine N-glycosylation enzyme membrane subunit Stt3
MNPFEPPSTTTPVASVSLVSIGILTVGTIGLGSIAAVLCGISCYRDIRGDNDDDFMALLLMFSVPLIAFAYIGIAAGMFHLRRRSKLGQIPFAVYAVALTALVVASLSGNPIIRWLDIFLICCIVSIVLSIRTATRYERACGG